MDWGTQMSRILLVEDHKTISKMIRRRIEESLDVDVVQAYTYAAAGAALAENPDFLIALLDLNLPDCEVGQIIDLVHAKKIRSIIFTGESGEKFRDNVGSKGVVDYVEKTGVEDLNHLVSLIRRIGLNRSIQVLAVDDDVICRKIVSTLLNVHYYDVFQATDGAEALAELERNPEIKLVITDCHMPNVDGYELTKKIRQSRGRNDLAIIGISGIDDKVLAARFLKCGANDFLSKPFAAEDFYCRVTQNIEAMENLALLRQTESELRIATERAIEASKSKCESRAAPT